MSIVRTMHARVARYRIEPDRCQDAVASFTEAGAEIAKLDGFRDGYVFVDADDGEILTITVWDSNASLDASDMKATSARRRAAEAVDGIVEAVSRYGVAVELTP
jgi:heme-degrading monooxygenase HmoA